MNKLFCFSLILSLSHFLTTNSYADQNAEAIRSSTKNQVRNIIEPILSKYCLDQCKLLNIEVDVDLVVPDGVAPGFEDVGAAEQSRIAPTSVRAKLLVDKMVGPNSRQKIFQLIQDHIDALEYPVTVDSKITDFPQPIQTAQKIGELRAELLKRFQNSVSEVFKQFCPQQCLLADVKIDAEAINTEESQFGNPEEFIHDGGVGLRISKIAATVLLDDTLSPEEQTNVMELVTLKTSGFKNVQYESKVLTFPHSVEYGPDGIARFVNGPKGKFATAEELKKSLTDQRESKLDSQSTSALTSNSTAKSDSKNTAKFDQKTTNSETSRLNQKTQESLESKNDRQEKYERYEKIERVENGDAVQQELKQVKLYGTIIAFAILLLLILMTALLVAGKNGRLNVMPASVSNYMNRRKRSQSEVTAPNTGAAPVAAASRGTITKRYEIEALIEELSKVFAEQPKVAKIVFSRIIKEEGIETTASYVSIFGEAIVIDLLRDPSLQRDVNDLMEFYAKNDLTLDDQTKLDLLKQLHNRTVSAKLFVTANRASHLFEFLTDMDGVQILDLIEHESLTVKAIVLTQVDPQKRSAIFAQIDETTKMKLLAELSRIDYLPKDYIFNVSNALKRKRTDNPKLNTDALPGSEVLVGLLEKSPYETQRSIIRSLEASNPDNARAVKSKLVSIDTLMFLRDNQILDLIMGLKHGEVVQFLKGASQAVRSTVLSKCPQELSADLSEELASIPELDRETYLNVERKILNKIKLLSNDGALNLLETNERMFSGVPNNVEMIRSESSESTQSAIRDLRKAAGW